MFKGFVDRRPKEGDVIECVGRGRISYSSGAYEISFIEPKLIAQKPILVEVLEILRDPTRAVENSNGEVRYYVRHGDLNSTYSQSTSYEGIMKSLKNVGRTSLMKYCDSFILKELHMRDKTNFPVILAKKTWEYHSIEEIKKYNYIESDGEVKYKLTKYKQ